jgi:hypothetical protein
MLYQFPYTDVLEGVRKLSRKAKHIAIAALSVLAASSVHASVIIQSGDAVDGWRIAFPVGVTVANEDQATATIDVTGDFTSQSALDLNFIQQKYDASQTITINEFSVDNNTSDPLASVDVDLSTLLPGSGQSVASYNNQAFNLTSPSVNVFSTQTVSSNRVHFAGTLPTAQTASFGAATGSNAGAITINGSPATSGLKKDFVVNLAPNGQQSSNGNPPTQPIISLSSGTSTPAAYGSLLGTPFSSNGNSFQAATEVFPATSKGFVEVNGLFNPALYTEALFLDVQINGVQATEAQIATLVADINSPNAYGADATIAYNPMDGSASLPVADPFGSEFNLLIDLPTGYLATHNLTQPLYYGIDLSQDPTLGGSAEIVSAAIIPEPAQLGLLALGSLGIFGLLGRRRRATTV